MTSRAAKHYPPQAARKLRDSANRLRMVGNAKGFSFVGSEEEGLVFRFAVDILFEQANYLDMAANRIEEEAKEK